MTLRQRELCAQTPPCSAPPSRDLEMHKPHGLNQRWLQGKASSCPVTGTTRLGGPKLMKQRLEGAKSLSTSTIFHRYTVGTMWLAWGGQGRTLETNVRCHFPGKGKYATAWQTWSFVEISCISQTLININQPSPKLQVFPRLKKENYYRFSSKQYSWFVRDINIFPGLPSQDLTSSP